jgi:hypothetical protein
MTDAERLAEIRRLVEVHRVGAEAVAVIPLAWLLAQFDAAQDDVATLKRVLLSDEAQLRQWERRTRELHADLMRTVRERDEAREHLEDAQGNDLARVRREREEGRTP